MTTRKAVFVALTAGSLSVAAQEFPIDVQDQPLPVESIGGVALPGVPVEVSDPPPAGAGLTSSGVDTSLYTDTRLTITVQEGTTEVINISSGYLNRIVTPFEDPKLVTVNTIQFRKEGSSLFLSAGGEVPVGVHIMSNDPADQRSISLALVPRPIPPRTIELRWPGQTADPVAARINSRRAARWEESQPYVDGIVELFAIIARGEVPPGYSLARATDGLTCEIPGVSIEIGQRLTGGHVSVYVMRATNRSDVGVEILQHAGCYSSRVLAVAPWPNAYLAPLESTELLVAVSNAPEVEPVDNLRPSLLQVVVE